MESLNKKLLLGYIFSNEYLGDMHDDKRYLYAHSQAILYLALPYAFHISGVFSISTSVFFKLFLDFKPHTLLFLILAASLLITLILCTRFFKAKYPATNFHNEVINTSKQEKKSSLRFSMYFFIMHVLLWILVEIPLIVIF